MTITDSAEIAQFIERIEKESKAYREEALRICWWMRGSISYDEAMLLSNQDLTIIRKILEDNREASKQAGVPIF